MTANTPLHDFAIEALKINTFLEAYIQSAEIRLSYVLGILGGHPHPKEVEELVAGPAAAVARRAKARTRQQAEDAVARRDRYTPTPEHKEKLRDNAAKARAAKRYKAARVPDGAMESYGVTPEHKGGIWPQDPKAEARVRYDAWTDQVVVGDIKDTDQAAGIIGMEMFKNKHGARITVGIIMRQDPMRWKPLTTKRGGPRRSWNGANLWQRIDGPIDEDVKPKTRRGRALSNSVGAEA